MSHNPLEVPSGTVLIDTYKILAHLNTGGMGEVYRGVNIHNDEEVAIKIVLPALAHDPKILSLFQKESTVLRRIAHDAIVRYEMFTIDPGIKRPCLVMEYVEGPSLSDRIEHGPLPAQAVLVLLRRLASGLEVAHQNGVVHRDLSPDNVILCDNDVSRAKIIDFGIAKASTPGSGTLIGGQFAGKPGYVAPEQLGLGDGTVTGQADIYSLGLLAAAASLGYPLNMGDTPAAAVMARMGVPDLTGVDPVLVPLLTWMLQPEAGDRPGHMADVQDWITEQIGPEVSVDPRSGPRPPPTSQAPVGRQTTVAPTASAKPPPPRAIPQETILDERVMPPPVSPRTLAETPAFMPTTSADRQSEAAQSASPFGPALQPPPDATPDATAATTPDAPEKKRRGMALLAGTLVLGIGAGGAWVSGVFTPADPIPDTRPDTVVLTLPVANPAIPEVTPPVVVVDPALEFGDPEFDGGESDGGEFENDTGFEIAGVQPDPKDTNPPSPTIPTTIPTAVPTAMPTVAPTVIPTAIPTPIPTPRPVIPNPQSWLQAAVASTPRDTCLWVAPQRTGTSELIVHGTDRTTLDRLRQQFQDQFGQPLALRLNPTAQGQCPALAVIRALERRRPYPGTGANPMELVLPQAITAQQDGLSGQIRSAGTRHLSVLLVDPLGRIQNISALVEAGQFSLSARRLRLPDAAQASLLIASDPSMLLLAIDSTAPLPIVGQVPDNAILPALQAAQFWSFLHQTLDALPEPAHYATAVVRWQR